MINLFRLLAFVSGCLFISGCQNIDVDFDFESSEETYTRIVPQQTDAFEDIELLYLTDAMKAYADTHINPDARASDKVGRLRELLFEEQYLNLQYSDDRTQTAAELFESRAGNCLSVMNLYIALARYVGLDAEYQTVNVRPVWDRRGGLLVLNQHINATGKLSMRETYIIDFTPELNLQQLTASTVSDAEARALYFNNLAVEKMVVGEFEASLVFLKNALWLEPELSIAWNNIGTAFNRLQQPELASYSYHMAFETDNTNATAVNNLARFFLAQGETAKAREYQRAIARFNNRNPYYHFERGNTAYLNDDLEGALDAYRRAIRIKEVEPDFYVALARTYERLGDEGMAERMTNAAKGLLITNAEIYQPSDEKVRIIDSQSILRNTGPGLVVRPNRGGNDL
ncbi:MAG: transglutaminase domain-containing protein [Pseudohongiellaceae bacterium]